MLTSLNDVFRRKPAWVKREISRPEAAILARRIRATGAVRGAEVGVASGFSSAVLIAAMAANAGETNLHSFDTAERCYFDPGRATGQAVAEIHGDTTGFHLTTGASTAAIEAQPPLDFLFIDGSHATPWPAFDVLSLGRFLKPGGWIALDDVEMTFQPRWRQGGKNGARDLYRAWTGPKTRYEGATGLAILDQPTPERIADSVIASLAPDWDVAIPPRALERFTTIGAHYGAAMRQRLAETIRDRSGSYGAWKPTEPEPGGLTLPD
ncbi:class I SAM-dependent methyltransferase [Brevundimonas lutea]|uniref:class I SAM-dependent methyltransferase n=1 Tax=Brevundimonas lutea TaxID=2293980 RepID=UPI0013CEF267|nr:class I SAM-dependent methyltransferase [Brevundimonas lutea]